MAFQIERRSIHLVIVVPDAVARLAYSAPGMRTIKAGVHNNMATFVIHPIPPARGSLETESTMVWYGPLERDHRQRAARQGRALAAQCG